MYRNIKTGLLIFCLITLQSCYFLNPKQVKVEPLKADPVLAKPIKLVAAKAILHGEKIKLSDNKKNIGYWGSSKDWVSWKIQINQPGIYRVSGFIASPRGESDLQCELAGQTTIGNISKTANWNKYQVEELGEFKILQAGKYELKLLPAKSGLWNAVNLKWIEASKIKRAP